jgi:AraC family transcriptional activator of pyochelin receptor
MMSSGTGAAAGGDVIVVSPEMTAILGPDRRGAPIPPAPIAMVVALGRGLWTLSIDPDPDVGRALAAANERSLLFLVRTEAVIRLGGVGLIEAGMASYHLTVPLRAIVLALCDPPAEPEVRPTYQLAKSIELMCETIRQFRGGQLAPAAGGGQMSPADTRRIMAARRLIDERASEKLTLDFIARDCGLNRSKLTRGFKELFDCTVAQAIAERRLELARRMLLTTDLPVSSVGYESGYLNNASFARAFGRRFGRSPSNFRYVGLAA